MNFTATLTCRALRRGAAAFAAALLAACGGGTEMIEPYAPTRMFALGDEISVLTNVAPKGRKYTVNALGTDGQISCALSEGTTASLLWTQQMALAYGFAFEECNPLNLVPSAWTFAVPGAKAADFLTQYEAAGKRFGPFVPTDVFSVLYGANDVLELYKDYLDNPTTDTGNAIVAILRERGSKLGREINALTDGGCAPAFIVSTMPLMDLTPFALKEARDKPTLQILYWLRQFSNAFNTGMRTTLVNDGSRWGLVELDAMLNAGVSNPSNYGLTNITAAACDPAKAEMPDCTTNTLVSGANPATWLWASDLWMGWRAHQYLGGYARGRVAGNPFANSCTS